MKIKFYEDCLLSKGYNRSVIVDTTRGKLEAIPNSLYHFIKENDTLSINEIKNKYSSEDQVIVDEYLDFLLKDEYAFLVDEQFVKNFPKINMAWDLPSQISNVIIVFKAGKWIENINKIVFLLESINCQDVEIRFKDSVQEEEINNLLDYFKKSRVNSIILIIPYLDFTDFIYEILSNQLRLEQIILYNSPKGKDIFFKTNQIKVSTKKIEDLFAINNINQFLPNMMLYMESLYHHSYFNRKLYIDYKGEIKNAPEGNFVLANISDFKSLEDIRLFLKNDQLTKYWDIKKEDCDVCKDCELKNICVDNRLPIKREDNTFYFEKECAYNPYISKWKGESGYLNLLETGVISNENHFKIDSRKVQKTNQKIWN
jgi:SPASM domain peptide maturase of grasp-with-spasm system